MYKKFYLTPGKQAPSGSTGKTLSDGGIVWIGESDNISADIESYEMSEAEVLAFHQDQLEPEIDKYIDQVAKDKGYGRLGVSPSVACLGYASFENTYQAEALAYGAWIASLWPVIYQIIADVSAGTRAIPTKEDIFLNLPEMVWPVV